MYEIVKSSSGTEYSLKGTSRYPIEFSKCGVIRDRYSKVVLCMWSNVQTKYVQNPQAGTDLCPAHYLLRTRQSQWDY